MPYRRLTTGPGPWVTVHTARLRMDVPEPRDAGAVLAIAGDLRTVRHNPSDLVSDLAEAEELVGRWTLHWQQRAFGYWCVREIGRVRLVGYCGVKSMLVRGQPVMNLLYRFRPEVWGRGYATEAARAAVTWAESRHPGATIVARVRERNQASRKVALKAGLRRDPRLDEDGVDGPDLIFSNRVAHDG